MARKRFPQPLHKPMSMIDVSMRVQSAIKHGGTMAACWSVAHAQWSGTGIPVKSSRRSSTSMWAPWQRQRSQSKWESTNRFLLLFSSCKLVLKRPPSAWKRCHGLSHVIFPATKHRNASCVWFLSWKWSFSKYGVKTCIFTKLFWTEETPKALQFLIPWGNLEVANPLKVVSKPVTLYNLYTLEHFNNDKTESEIFSFSTHTTLNDFAQKHQADQCHWGFLVCWHWNDIENGTKMGSLTQSTTRRCISGFAPQMSGVSNWIQCSCAKLLHSRTQLITIPGNLRWLFLVSSVNASELRETGKMWRSFSYCFCCPLARLFCSCFFFFICVF